MAAAVAGPGSEAKGAAERKLGMSEKEGKAEGGRSPQAQNKQTNKRFVVSHELWTFTNLQFSCSFPSLKESKVILEKYCTKIHIRAIML